MLPHIAQERRGFLALALVTTISAGQTSGLAPAFAAADDTVGIVVRLADPPAARYAGGIAGLAPTSRERSGGRRLDGRSSRVASYRAHLAGKQAEFVAAARAVAPEAKIVHRYQVVLNGVSLRVPRRTVDAIAAIPGVVAVYPDVLRQPTTERSPAFIGAKPAWRDLGGQDVAGEGVIVGVLDTGVWPEHPSFSDPDPEGNPYPPAGVSPACQFAIGANPGPAFACNNKLIGAYRFLAAYDVCVGAGECAMPAAAFTSARDDAGHGTHTASTAAGNGKVAATLFGVARGKVSGIAPRAHVIAYKVCGEDGCFDSDSAAAVEQAILDGVDVINFSISGGTAPYHDVVELAFLDAYAAGIFVAASAGNEGPVAETVHHRGPWVMTVGASTQKREFASKLTLRSSDGAKLSLRGATVTAGIDPALPVLDAATLGDPLCLAAGADGAFAGTVALCQRGGNTRTEKSFNVRQRGAAGMILYNPALQGVATDNHTIPSIHLENDAGAQLLAFIAAHPAVTATFTAGKAGGAKADRMAPFSSRGGPFQLLGVSKPDVTAPGVQILAGNTPDSVTLTDADDELFQAIQGTSMSSPHVAGAGALIRALHPSFTAGQIKSTLMALASAKKLFDEDGTTPFDPFDAGAGRLAIKKAADVPITFDATSIDFESHGSDLWNANMPSLYLPNVASTFSVTRTAHSVLTVPKTLKLKVEAPADLVVTVPASITVPAGGDFAFPIGVDVASVPEGAVRHAAIIFKGGPQLRFPITVRKISQTTTLYGGNANGSALTPGGVVILDQAVGTGTLLGDPVTPGGLTGIGFTSAGRLYGTSISGGASRLVEIDPDTGGLLATVGFITDGPTGIAISIGDLAVQPGTDVLFGIRSNSDGFALGGQLYTIDATTAVGTFVGDSGTCVGGGLAFGPDGTLYFTSFASCSGGSALHVLDPATAAILRSAPVAFFYDALAARPTDGALFATPGGGGGGDLFYIDPATGIQIFWGRTATGSLSDLAFR